MTLVRSVPIILVIILALTAFDSPRAAAQTDCARTPIDMSTMIGAWSSASDCHSPNRPIDPEGRGEGIYYAVYYDFHVSRTSEVTITLESPTDTYLYLLTGAGRNGNIIDKNDDIDYDARNLNSRITKTLEPGSYSIEATTYAKEATGEFTLTIEGIDFATLAEADRDILIALYNATDGNNWANNTNWLTDAPLSEWHGITTDDDGRVTKIELYRNNLTGAVPPELGNLSELKQLSLDDNRLTQLPPELGNLSNLVELNLGVNQLTQIPPELGNLSNLVELRLGVNRITQIPPELGNLSELKQLVLGVNRLPQIPPELGNLSNLTWLGLDSNRLTQLPPELSNLSKLGRLSASNNRLTQIPPELGNLSSLRSLGIDGNRLTGAIPPELGDLSDLTFLDLADNQLTGAIPPELGSLPNLEFLFLSDNQLTGTIPPELGNLSKLHGLSLHSNQLTGAIPPELGSLPNLEFLFLSDNQLTGTIPPELGSLDMLDNLQLNENQLTGHVPSELGNLNNLESLDISGNALSGELPHSLTNLTLLVILRFNINAGLCAPSDSAFQTWLRSLSSVLVRGNTCRAPPPRTIDTDRAALTAFYQTAHGDNWTNKDNWLTDAPMSEWHGVTTHANGLVTSLNLMQNGLSGEISPELGNLAYLKHLDLSDNELTGVIPPELGDIRSYLEFLHISDNRLTGTIPSELGDLNELKSLNLSENRLTGTLSSESLRLLFNLRSLELSDNELSGRIPRDIDELRKLERLALDGNRLTDELPQTMTSLKRLETFHFHDNDRLCAPADAELQDWLQSIDEVRGPNCDDTPTPEPTPDPTPTPPPASSECTQSISARAPAQGQWTSNCVSTNRTEHGEYYAKYFTFTLDRPTTVEVLLESRTDSYIFLLDSDGETVTENDDYKYRNAGFLTALKPGEYTIEATTYSTQESGDFTLTMTQPELDALHALYNATDGANWDDSDNWLTGAPLSEWHGVKTDEEGRVIEIYLIGNNLSGEIPREMGDLGELQWLFLSRNGLSGSIPQELGDLYKLKILMLSNNELSGSIPARLGNMAALEELHLSRNQLSGRIPASLGRLDNLRKLSLTVNELSGSIPAELANLSSLRTLSIAANEISGPIPYQLTDMENLTHIYLWGNDLSEGSFVRYLGDLESLEFLDIGGNDIDGAEVLAELDGLPNLTGLGLHDSDLTDADVLRYMDDLQALNLEFLNLSGNRLSDLQILVGLSRITTLQRIAINDNDFSGQLPRSMTALTLMRLFYFHDNDGLCAPDDSEFHDWLQGSPEIREFLRGGYPDVKGPTCTSGTTPANAPAPTSNGADQFAAVLQTPEQLVPPHSLSLLESIQPGG